METGSVLARKLLTILAVLPMLLVSISGSSQKVMTKTFTAGEYGFVQVGNNTFEFSRAAPDTVEIEDVDGTMVKKIVMTDPYPLKMDGKDVYDGDYLIFKGSITPAQYLSQKIKKDIRLLEDGFYNFNATDIVVDTNGKICALYYHPIYARKGDLAKNNSDRKKPLVIEKKLAQKLFNDICNQLANFPKLTAPVVEGQKIVTRCNLSEQSSYYQLKVQKHRAYFYNKERWIELK